MEMKYLRRIEGYDELSSYEGDLTLMEELVEASRKSENQEDKMD